MSHKKAKRERQQGNKVIIENDGMSMTGRLPNPQDIPLMVASLGGELDDCPECEGFIGHDFTDAEYAAGTMHFGPMECPARLKTWRELTQLN